MQTPAAWPLDAYCPSGRVPTLRTLLCVLAALPVLAACAWGYAQLLHWGPPWWIRPLLGGLFALLVGLVILDALTRAHSRAPRLNVALAMLLGLFALWFHWVVIFRTQGVPQASAFVLNGPLNAAAQMFQWAQGQALRPSDGVPVFWRGVGWLLELLGVLGLSAAVAHTQANAPYGEQARRWAEKEHTGELFWPDGSIAQLGGHLAQTGPLGLCHMLSARDVALALAAAEWWTLRVTGWSVQTEPAARWLELTAVHQRRDQSGKVRADKRPLVRAWPLLADDYAEVMQHLLTQAADPAAEPASATPSTTMPALRESHQPESDNAVAPALEAALAALHAGQSASAVALAQGQCQHPDASVQADAWRICALAHSTARQWTRAFDAFHALHAVEPSVHNALQLATTSVMAGELMRGEAWFERAWSLNEMHSAMPPPQLRTAFMSALEQAGEQAALLPHLDWLAQAYRHHHHTDTHLLWMHGLPPLSVFLERSQTVLQAVQDAERTQQWFTALASDLDAAGQAQVHAHVQQQPNA